MLSDGAIFKLSMTALLVSNIKYIISLIGKLLKTAIGNELSAIGNFEKSVLS